MIAGLFWMIVANVAAFAGAGALLGRIRTGEGPDGAAIFLFLKILLTSAAVLVCGGLGILTSWGLGILGGATLALLLAFGLVRKPDRLSLPDMGPWMWAFLALMAVRLALQVWFFAPQNGDALSYHLPKVAEWVRAGRITSEVGLDPRATFPAGFELVEIWWVVFLHHDVLIEMAGVEFLALAVLSAYALARRMGIGARGACLAAVLYGMTPTLHLQATSCLNDLPVAAMVVFTTALIAGRAPAGLLIAAVGMGVGIKATYGYTLPGLGVYYWSCRREPPAGSPSRHWPWAPAVLGVLLGVFWYGRNLFLYGNPIYPFGSAVARDWAQQTIPRLSSLRDNLLNLVDHRIYDGTMHHGTLGKSISGWGPGAFVLGLPAVFIWSREDSRLRRLAISLVIVLAIVFMMVAPDPWCMRFTLFFPVLLCLSAGWLAERSRPVWIASGCVLILLFAGTVVPAEFPTGAVRSLAIQGWGSRSTATDYIRELPKEAIACGPGAVKKAYLLYGPDFSRGPRYIRCGDPDEILAFMDREGIRILCAPSSDGPVAEIVRSGGLRRKVGNLLERIR